MTTIQQQIFPPKPKKIITPLTPKVPEDPLDIPVIEENALKKRKPKSESDDSTDL